MKVLVYGSQGWIGKQFIEILISHQINYVEGNARVDNDIELFEELYKTEPTNVISFIGRTHGKIGDKTYSTIDYLEQEGKLLENI